MLGPSPAIHARDKSGKVRVSLARSSLTFIFLSQVLPLYLTSPGAQGHWAAKKRVQQLKSSNAGWARYSSFFVNLFLFLVLDAFVIKAFSYATSIKEHNSQKY